MRALVSGTDTGVGKTRVVAAIALALRRRGSSPTIVKLVQTGTPSASSSDAARAGELAGCEAVELAGFVKAADPWSAALAEGMPAIRAADLASELRRIDGSVLAEGVGGLAVPLNRTEDFATVAQAAQLAVVLVIGLRPGCMNHALLSLSLCAERRLPLLGCVFVDRWRRSEEAYVNDVRRALQGKVKILGILEFEKDERRSVLAGAELFKDMVL